MADLTKPISELKKITRELGKSKINKPIIIIGNKIDLPKSEKNLNELEKMFGKEQVIPISTKTEQGFNELKQAIWKKSGLIRIYPKEKDEPMILEATATIKDFVQKIHKDLLAKFKFATITGPSSKFPNQMVGLDHILKDEDIVELKLEK
jgi:hypothetical protein